MLSRINDITTKFRLFKFFLLNIERFSTTPPYASREDSELPCGALNRSDMLNLAFKFIYGNLIEGDYFEFGCWTGRTFRMAYNCTRYPYYRGNTPYHSPIHLWAFDSFKGLPSIKQIDEDKKWKEGDFFTSAKEFIDILKSHHIPDDSYSVVEGFYEDSLTKELQNRILERTRAAVIYVDCDLYESTKTVLNFVKPLLQNGTVICFDDYYCFKGRPDKGEQLAIKEFLENSRDLSFVDYYNFGWHGKSFIISCS